ncbi:MAG: ABC transporter substrate-binding protein [Flavobacteriaceae bacterium]
MTISSKPNRRDVIKAGFAAGAAGAFGLGSIARAAAQDTMQDFKGAQLVANAYGGSFGKAWQEYVVAPFEKKFNARVTIVESLTGDTVAKVRASRNNPQMDVAMLGDSGAVLLAADGLYEPLTEAAVPNLKELLPQARNPGDPYAEFLFGSEVFAYNTKALSTPPKSWKDLYKDEYKGRLLLPDLTNSTSGVVFLVHLAELNGGSVDNIDPAFEALERLRPNVLTYWSSQQQISGLMASGEAWAAVWTPDRAGALMKSGAPVDIVYPEEGVKVFGNGIGVVKGTKVPELAAAYVNFVLSKEVQSSFHANALLTPTNAKAELPEEARRFVPDPAIATTADWGKVVEHMPQWVERWNRIVTR